MPATRFEPTELDDVAVPAGHCCPGCAAPVGQADQFCGGCGAEQLPQSEAAPADGAARQAPAGRSAEVPRHFRCENCGAEVAIDAAQRSYLCAFCDSAFVVELPEGITGRQAPEFVIGFAITPQDARERFRRWLGSNDWFRPGDLASVATIEDKLRGVYLPFWHFSMLAQSTWTASIGEYWYRTETYTTMENGKLVTKTRRVREIEWWPLLGRHHRFYSGYLVSGSRGLPQQFAERIKPYHLAALQRYRPSFLAGWVAEEYSVDRAAAETMCREEFARLEQRNVAAFLPGDTHRELRVESRLTSTGSDLLLLPVYLLSYRYGATVYRFLLNGQTGCLYGDKPLSRWRIGAVAAGAAVGVAAILLLLFFLLRR